MTGQMIDEVKSMWKILPPAAVPRELLVETDKAWVHDRIIMHAVIATIDPDACNSLAFESDTQQTRCRLITLSLLLQQNFPCSEQLEHNCCMQTLHKSPSVSGNCNSEKTCCQNKMEITEYTKLPTEQETHTETASLNIAIPKSYR